MEVVLALGIISFAIVGIMGLFPVAMRSAQESQRETRATLIAEQIYSDLATAKGGIRKIVIRTNYTQLSVNLTAAATNTVYFNDQGQPLGLDIEPNSRYLAEVTVFPGVPSAGLSRVQVSVETPAEAPKTNRIKYLFVTDLRSAGT